MMMPNEADANEAEPAREAGIVTLGKRLRPRWQRWLLWSSVRLLVLAGAGAGVGTMQMRARPPDLMRQAKRIATVDAANGYFWTSKGELRLYQYQANGATSYKWDEETKKATLVGMLPTPKGQLYADPRRDLKRSSYSIGWQDERKQYYKVGVYNKAHSSTRGKPLPTPDRIWKIKSVPGMQQWNFFDVAPSSDGKRTAYFCPIPNRNWNDLIMERLKRNYRAPFRGQGGAILISDVDGSRTEVLGTVKDNMPNEHGRYSHSGTTYSLQSLFWCPDGKHLSFMYGDGVWEVPVK